MGLALAIVAMVGPATAGRSEAERAAIVSVLVAAEHRWRQSSQFSVEAITTKSQFEPSGLPIATFKKEVVGQD